MDILREVQGDAPLHRDESFKVIDEFRSGTIVKQVEPSGCARLIYGPFALKLVLAYVCQVALQPHLNPLDCVNALI